MNNTPFDLDAVFARNRALYGDAVMVHTTANSAGILTPDQVTDLLIRPAFEMSVAAQVASLITTSSSTTRFPVVAADPSAAWVAEGGEIAVSDASLTEIDVTPSKLAGLTIATRELVEDSDPSAAEVVGQGLARDIARKLDAAFFGALPSPAPAGLAALTGVTPVSAGANWTNVDPFVDALAAAEGVNATLTAFVANPADLVLLSKIKQGTGSQVPLLTADPTAPARRVIFGVPLLVSPAVTAGTVWGVPRDRAFLVSREDATVVTDYSVFFTSDRVAIRATMRVGFGFPHPAALVRITKGA